MTEPSERETTCSLNIVQRMPVIRWCSIIPPSSPLTGAQTLKPEYDFDPRAPLHATQSSSHAMTHFTVRRRTTANVETPYAESSGTGCSNPDPFDTVDSLFYNRIKQSPQATNNLLLVPTLCGRMPDTVSTVDRAPERAVV
jgi:hypothetical protein